VWKNGVRPALIKARLVPALALLTVGHKLLVRANQWSRQA
jgi:hypothetical protein